MAIRFAIERANRSSLAMTKTRLHNAAIADDNGLNRTRRSDVPKTPDPAKTETGGESREFYLFEGLGKKSHIGVFCLSPRKGSIQDFEPAPERPATRLTIFCTWRRPNDPALMEGEVGFQRRLWSSGQRYDAFLWLLAVRPVLAADAQHFLLPPPVLRRNWLNSGSKLQAALAA
jgi:hypothetical protein